MCLYVNVYGALHLLVFGKDSAVSIEENINNLWRVFFTDTTFTGLMEAYGLYAWKNLFRSPLYRRSWSEDLDLPWIEDLPLSFLWFCHVFYI